MWLLLGPGMLAMLGENDGPSMISYAADGATYGLGFFVPFIPVLFVMAYVCQEMCMRVGAVTHRGFGELVLQRYGRIWGWVSAGDLVVTNVITLIAESGWPISGSARRPRSGWACCWWCSHCRGAATGAGNGSCWAWRCSTGCSWPWRCW